MYKFLTLSHLRKVIAAITQRLVGVEDKVDNLPVVEVDTTLTKSGEAADALVVGNRFDDLATVAWSGDYDDLSNTPTYASVAYSGLYSDLTGTPTIPTKTSQLTNDSGYVKREIRFATYQSTTYNDILTDYNAHKVIVCQFQNYIVPLVDYDSETLKFTFGSGRSSNDSVIRLTLSATTGWSYSSKPYNAVEGYSTIESGDYIPFVDVNSLNRLKHSTALTFGTDATKYLANNATWQSIPTVPTTVSSFTNDAGYLTLSTLPIYDGSVSTGGGS